MKFSRYVVPVLVLAFAGYLFYSATRGAAETPGAFLSGLTLDEARERSATSGKPVLVFATADWCGPCQAFKRTALADPQVNEAISRNTEPVYLDLTDARRDVALQAQAQSIGVQGIPALVMIRDGEVVARREGVIPTRELLTWLTDD